MARRHRSSNGWQEWSIDLSQYAGQQVEVSIAYASDWGTQGLGTFVDDTTVLVDGVEQSTTSFETRPGRLDRVWRTAGSEPNNNDWQRDQLAFEEGAVVVTDDTVYAGFGAEGLAPAKRDDFVARVAAAPARLNRGLRAPPAYTAGGARGTA